FRLTDTSADTGRGELPFSAPLGYDRLSSLLTFRECRMRLSAASLCLLYLPFTVAAAPVPKERADAEKVVGTCKLVKSTNYPDGLPVELTMVLKAGGKLILRQSNNGGPVIVSEGEYKVIKDELPYSVKLANGET